MSFGQGAVEVIKLLESKCFTLEEIVKNAVQDKDYSDFLQITIEIAGLVK